jgi:predicted oxidoreductase (fatty acid repression mutant protein)
MESRRSYYSINSKSPISDEEIKKIVDHAVLHVPSAFNSQSARIVVLLGDKHKKLWDIVKKILKSMVSLEAYPDTEAKIDNAFRAGHGTILFYENQSVVEGLQNVFPSYSDNFPVWSQHTSAMHQYAIWLMLREAGLGASLQHYNPIIDKEVEKEFNINPKWKLIAQMPFGTPVAEPNPKEFQPLEGRVTILK